MNTIKKLIYNNLGIIASLSIVTLPFSWTQYNMFSMTHLLLVACLCFWIHNDRDTKTKEMEKRIDG